MDKRALRLVSIVLWLFIIGLPLASYLRYRASKGECAELGGTLVSAANFSPVPDYVCILPTTPTYYPRKKSYVRNA